MPTSREGSTEISPEAFLIGKITAAGAKEWEYGDFRGLDVRVVVSSEAVFATGSATRQLPAADFAVVKLSLLGTERVCRRQHKLS